jgi:rubrerythrin
MVADSSELEPKVVHPKEKEATLMDKVYDNFIDEVGGVTEYLNLAKDFDYDNDDYVCQGLTLIAKDEESHARFLYDVLKRRHYEIPEKDIEKYHEMERMFHNW